MRVFRLAVCAIWENTLCGFYRDNQHFLDYFGQSLFLGVEWC